MNAKLSTKTSDIYLFIFIFIYIYAPLVWFLPINIGSILGILSFFYLTICRRKIVTFFVYKNLSLVILIAFLVVYSLILDGVVENNISTYSPSIKNIRMFIEGFFPALLLADILNKRGHSLLSLFKILVYTSVVQVIIALLMINSEIKRFMFYDFMNYPSESPLLSPEHFLLRGFGLSQLYLFTFPFSQGMITIIGLVVYKYFKGIQKTIIIFGIFSSAILVLFNARVGFLPIIIFLLLSIIVYFHRYIKTHLMLLCGLFLIILSYNSNKQNILNENIDKILTSVDATVLLITEGEKVDTYKYLFSDGFLTLPANPMHFIFGNGHELSPGEKIYSDIGYIRNLYYGGIVYSFILYLFFVIFFIKMHKNSNSKELSFVYIVFFISLLVAQIKGNIFSLNEVSRLLFLIFIFNQFNQNRYKIKK